jgi:hypothetical protein
MLGFTRSKRLDESQDQPSSNRNDRQKMITVLSVVSSSVVILFLLMGGAPRLVRPLL